MLTHMPNMTILAPSCYDEFKLMLDYAVNECNGPVAIRYPKASVSFRKTAYTPIIYPEKLTSGSDILMLSCGRMTDTAMEAQHMLCDYGISCSVVNVRTVKPFDIKLIEDELKDKKLFVTIEDNLVQGGMGQYIASQANNTVPVLHLGFDTCFVPHGKQEELFRINALDSKSVCERILTFYKGMTD